MIRTNNLDKVGRTRRVACIGEMNNGQKHLLESMKVKDIFTGLGVVGRIILK
jgi:hypothetical protein